MTPRYRTGDERLDAKISDLVEALGPTVDRRMVFETVVSALLLGREALDRGDLKLANNALKELRHAFAVFTPYRANRKAAIFGSARTQREDPLYEIARSLGADLAERDWMIITGAGPGIMEAGIEGAGPESSFGVGIQLPFEPDSAHYLANDPKLIEFRYFFTRKLNFMKESDGFVLLPGGFGTMDEAFELLTLIQTGKSPLAPVVLLDVPGGTYWTRWRDFVVGELGERGYIDEHDLSLVTITDSSEAAVEELVRFYDRYHSHRYVDGDLVLRLQRAVDNEELAALNAEFADIVTAGAIEAVDAAPIERRDRDHPDLARIRFTFDRRSHARLRHLIDTLNR